MKITTSLFIAAALALLAFFIYEWAVPVETADVPTSERRYEQSTIGLSFVYPNGYELQERRNPGSEMREHYTIELTNAPTVPNGEAPPSITIDAYQNNLDAQTTEGWIRNASQSNFKLSSGVLATTTLDGAEALMYQYDGLYQGTTIVQARDAWVYAFTVTYLSPQDPIVEDFARLLQTVDVR